MDAPRPGAGASRRSTGQPKSHGRRRARSRRTRVGEGFHTYDGLRHAEIIALDAAGAAARGATLYVNLEPCCHTGRTGPCTRALIAAGVARVVAAMPDPNPAVAGRGFRELRNAGIEVISGVLEERGAATQRSVRDVDHGAASVRDAQVRDDARRPAGPARVAQLAAQEDERSAGSRRRPRAPKFSACATPPTPFSPASAPCWPTIRCSPTAPACRAAAACFAWFSTPVCASARARNWRARRRTTCSSSHAKAHPASEPRPCAAPVWKYLCVGCVQPS